MIDATTGRQLAAGLRRIMTDDDWQWITSKVDGQHDHLLIASSLPFLLSYGMHHVEAWAEAVADRAWDKRLRGLGERVRLAADLDHWACFQHSYREFEDLIVDAATGKRGDPPQSVLLFGGDVHHCWVSEMSLPDDAPPTRTPIWQIVCSGIRNELKIREPATLHLGHTRLAAALGRALVSTTRVGTPRLRWRPVTRPHFQNQIGTLEIADGEVGVRIEQVAGSWRKPRLLTVTEHKLL